MRNDTVHPRQDTILIAAARSGRVQCVEWCDPFLYSVGPISSIFCTPLVLFLASCEVGSPYPGTNRLLKRCVFLKKHVNRDSDRRITLWRRAMRRVVQSRALSLCRSPLSLYLVLTLSLSLSHSHSLSLVLTLSLSLILSHAAFLS